MAKRGANPPSIDALLDAIVCDDITKVKKLLTQNSSLIAAVVEVDRLFDTAIYHWLYVGDSALHLAAAGYRTEIVGLLLEAGVDSNATQNRRKSLPLHYAADGYINGPAWNEKRQLKTIHRLLVAGRDQCPGQQWRDAVAPCGADAVCGCGRTAARIGR